jgi:Domain of unknown function (DUF5943)
VGTPEIPIDVDPVTGIWRTDGLPMIYLPRHFLVNNHKAVEEALGMAAYRLILRIATDKSAFDWCTAQARTHQLTPEQTFRHYFKRLSQRGWGMFEIEQLDPEGGNVCVRLEQSVFVLEHPGPSAGGLCYMFEGFVTGAMRFVMAAQNEGVARNCSEVQCAGNGVHHHCRFATTPG